MYGIFCTTMRQSVKPIFPIINCTINFAHQISLQGPFLSHIKMYCDKIVDSVDHHTCFCFFLKIHVEVVIWWAKWLYACIFNPSTLVVPIRQHLMHLRYILHIVFIQQWVYCIVCWVNTHKMFIPYKKSHEPDTYSNNVKYKLPGNTLWKFSLLLANVTR